MTAPGDRPPLALAYLSSLHPALSMTFVLREIVQLRRSGFRIETVSVSAPDRPPEAMTAEERSEAARTYALKPHGIVGALAGHASALFTRPAGYLRGWALAFQLGRLDLRRLAFNLAYFTEALMVGRWMRAKSLRHLHVHLGSQPATVGMFVKHVFGVGLSITVHGPDEFYDAPGQYLSEKVAAADFICCISHYARSQLMRLSPYEHWSKLVVCRLGVDPQVFRPAEPRSQPSPFRILCVGRLTPAKGQHLLVDAVARLGAEGRDVHLHVVGAGIDRDSLERQTARAAATRWVSFEGAVNQDRIRDFYGMADCFCIPSFAEGIPIVLMEAMAMEIACVTTRITGIPELIRDGVDGLLVAPSDVDALVEALRSLIDDPALRRRLGASGRQRVVEHYDLAANVERLARVFRARVESGPT
ncbi:MAG: glycosyltransferase family 4 protein [Caldimonas sp.]